MYSCGIINKEEENKKLPNVPIWATDMTCQAWINEVELWAETNAKPEKKCQALIEALKKNKERKG